MFTQVTVLGQADSFHLAILVHGAGEMAMGALNGADKGKRSGLLVNIAESSPTTKATSGSLG